MIKACGQGKREGERKIRGGRRNREGETEREGKRKKGIKTFRGEVSLITINPLNLRIWL